MIWPYHQMKVVTVRCNAISPYPPGIESDKINTNFNKGILTITLSKATETQKHIPSKA